MTLHIQKLAGSALAFTLVMSTAAMHTANAQTFDVQCVKGNDERTIKVVSPGQVGQACDVQYRRPDTGLSTPYHADNSTGFCGEKANEIVTTLITSGYTCGQSGGTLTAEARAPEVEPESEVAPVIAVTPASEVSALTVLEPTQASVQLQETPQEEMPAPDTEAVSEEVAEAVGQLEEVTLDPVAVDTEEVASSVIDADPSEAEKIEAFDISAQAQAVESLQTPLADEDATQPQVASQSFSGQATTGPATLGVEALPELEKIATPVPTGRLVGAAPSEPAREPAREPAQAVQPTPVSAPAAPDQTQVSDSTSEPGPKPTKGRNPKEVIVATLNAQVAAWNEGNLQAFMDTYWRDDDLKFVSGTSITKGWSSTMKRYRESYEGDGGYGQLALEKIDVQEMTNDVAVVTGRFNLVNDGAASAGVFTLVMQRMNGVWRIVHDHTVPDPQ